MERYLQLIRELVVSPEIFFRTEGGKQSPTMMRDRAMVLLAAEGLRPGSLGNLTINDFKYKHGAVAGYIDIRDNVAKRQASAGTRTPKAKGTRSTQIGYNSNITVKLWPFTCMAIKQYIDGERAEVLGRQLRNRSKSFLFVGDHGGPIADRTTIAVVFSRLERRLRQSGLLNTADGDPYARGAHYDLTAYTLRHSAVTLFYKVMAHKPGAKDLMRQRFGWTANRKMPDRYANRAMSDAASVNMFEFHEELLQALAAKRQ
jgi:integrase